MPQVDYRGEEVNVHNFLRVLAGALAMPGHSKPSLWCCCRMPLVTASPCDWHSRSLGASFCRHA